MIRRWFARGARQEALLERIALGVEALLRELTRIETEKVDEILRLQPTAENLMRAIDRSRRSVSSKGRHPMFTEDSER